MVKGIEMQPDAKSLLEIAGITTPLIGFYDTPDIEAFEPLTEPDHCVFSCYENWLAGESVLFSDDQFQCLGSGYWFCGVESIPRENFVRFLVGKEGLKSSPEVMNEWLGAHPPYRKEHPYIVIGPLREDSYDYLKTVTFFVNPDQLSLLMMGCEYHNAAVDIQPVVAPFGSGCGQLAALFRDLDANQAMIGATDIVMRQHLPPSVLALTVTKPMFRELCDLDERSFLYQPYWKELRKAREESGEA
jgi:hypothetical protein